MQKYFLIVCTVATLRSTQNIYVGGGYQCQQILSVLYHTILLLLVCIIPSSTDVLSNYLILRRKETTKASYSSAKLVTNRFNLH